MLTTEFASCRDKNAVPITPGASLQKNRRVPGVCCYFLALLVFAFYLTLEFVSRRLRLDRRIGFPILRVIVGLFVLLGSRKGRNLRRKVFRDWMMLPSLKSRTDQISVDDKTIMLKFLNGLMVPMCPCLGRHHLRARSRQNRQATAWPNSTTSFVAWKTASKLLEAHNFFDEVSTLVFILAVPQKTMSPRCIRIEERRLTEDRTCLSNLFSRSLKTMILLQRT